MDNCEKRIEELETRVKMLEGRLRDLIALIGNRNLLHTFQLQHDLVEGSNLGSNKRRDINEAR